MAKIETTFIRPQEVFTPDTGKAKVVYDGYQNNPHEIVLQENLDGDVEDVINDTFVPNADGNVAFTDSDNVSHELLTAQGLGKAQVIATTWSALKTLRDGGNLVAGSLYRITDYVTTTAQENTQSAGHQFDIVLLALSANKLAEEGWAMEHPTDVYDVTFDDGVTLKCYLYFPYEDGLNIVRCDTLFGAEDINPNWLIIEDEEKKIAKYTSDGEPFDSSHLNQENVPYNYFQNSNLSAWKVWYCLDNDTTRFAWADDSVDNETYIMVYYGGATPVQFIRTPEEDMEYDGQTYLCWRQKNQLVDDVFTLTETPESEDSLYSWDGKAGEMQEVPYSSWHVEELHIATNELNGRGVIYRLIDEWNNDIPYDFKNIQFLRKLDGGQIDAQGTDIYCYTFTLYDLENAEYKDASIFAIEYANDEEGITPCYNNSISGESAYNSPIPYANKYSYALPCTIFLSSVESGTDGWGAFDNKIIGGYSNTFVGRCARNIVFGSGTDYTDLQDSFVCGSERASMENI